YGRVAGDRGGHTADGRLNLAVPMHVGVVEHRVAASTHGAVLTGFTFEEDVHQTVAQIRGMRPLRQLEARVADRIPNAVRVHGIVHHRMADAVVAAHATGIADDDDLGAVQLNARGARRDRGVQVAIFE